MTDLGLNNPDEGLLGGALAKASKSKYGKGKFAEQSLKVQLERRKGILDIDRKSWFPNWVDIAQHFRPYRGRLYGSGEVYDTNKGWRRNWAIVDSTPLIASNTCAAGLLAGVTS